MHGKYDESDFMFTVAAWMIPSASGTLSAMSSILIMTIILRSTRESRFSAYHVIMFFMSFWDAIASIAIALTTIPMPSDVHEVYPFKGGSFGSVGTCEAQGFLIWMGSFLAVASNSALNVYFLCTIRYGMTEERFKKRVLPIMLVLCMIVSLPVPLAALRMGYINPQPLANFCTGSAYPAGCDELEKSNEDGESTPNCIRGGITEAFAIVKLIYVFLGFTFLVLLTSLVLVVATVFETEMVIRRARRLQRNRTLAVREGAEGGDIGTTASSSISPREVAGFKRTRAVLYQALMYIFAFLLTWGWVVVIIAETRKDSFQIPRRNIMILNSFFQPLQGFFNAIIFIHQKASRLRQAHSNLSVFQSFITVIIAPAAIPDVLVSRIEIVDEDLRRDPLRPRQGQYSAVLAQQENNGMRRIGTNLGEASSDNSPPSSISSNNDSLSLLSLSNKSSLGDISVLHETESVNEDGGNASTSSSCINVSPRDFGEDISSMSATSSISDGSPNITQNSTGPIVLERVEEGKEESIDSDVEGV